MDARTIHFTKMHGAGNDYIYVYLPDNPIADPARASVEWSRAHTGVGSDGLILIDRSLREEADFAMRIFNNDGSEAMMCGNGIRCVAKYVYDHGLTTKTCLRIDTLSGIKSVELHLAGDRVESVTVDMGVPETLGERPVVGGTYVSMGNPHVVFFVEDVMQTDIAAEGRRLEYEALRGKRSNIEFATLRADGSLRMRVWERGSGTTMACGTGACATLVAASLVGLVGRRAHVEMDGGVLLVEWRADGHVMMTGPAATVFEGELKIENYECRDATRRVRSIR